MIYHWKAYLSGSQKNHVNTILSVIFKIYGPPLQRPQISQYQFFDKNAKKTRQITWFKGVTTIHSFDLFDLKETERLYMYMSSINRVALPRFW